MKDMPRHARALAVLLLGAVLAACGGGGGGTTATIAATTPEPSPTTTGSTATPAADTGAPPPAGTPVTTPAGDVAMVDPTTPASTTDPAAGSAVNAGAGSGAGGTSSPGGGGTTVAGGGTGTTGSTGSTGTATGSTSTPSTTTTTVAIGSAPMNYTLADVGPYPAKPTSAPPPPSGPKVLVVYDAPANDEYEKLGFSYAIMLRNLLGHFDAAVDLVPVQQYTSGQVAAHAATFYLGASYNNPIPASFLADAMASTQPLVWFKYNLWELAGDPAYQFTAKTGISFSALRGLNATPTAAAPQPGFFDTITYKGLDFVKYYAYDAALNVIHADPDVGITAITDPGKAVALVNMRNDRSGEQAPYVVRSGNFWYVADMPFSFIGPRDRYLVLADLLHDMLGIQHAESHKAMVRLEDVGAQVSVAAMKKLSDFLSGRNIRFSIAVIPHHMDPFGSGNDGVPQEIPLAKATALRTSLDYALQRGAEIVMHGYTHQYGAMKNPWTGMSGDDYEFWDIVHNAPVPEDSTAWATARYAAGLYELTSAGYGPVAWETPHYFASSLASKAVPQAFNTTYQRVVYITSDKPDFTPHPGKDFAAGQIFPYVIARDWYGQRVLPENLGNIEYDISKIDPTSYFVYSWQEIYTNAQYALAVRDGFASFFFHPFWLEKDVGTNGYQDFTQLVDGITKLGYSWVTPSMLTQ